MNKNLIAVACSLYIAVSAIVPACEARDVSERYTVLSLAQGEISANSAKVGDEFKVKTMDLLSTEGVTIPAGSILEGKVSKVIKPNYVSTDSEVRIKIDKALLPNGPDYEFRQNKPEIVLMNPLGDKGPQKIGRRLPAAVGSGATSIALGSASSLSGGVIYPIALGGSLVTGLIQGAIFPEKGYNRLTSSLHRGYRSTPIGTAQTVVSKGRSFDVKQSDAVSVVFHRNDLLEAKAMGGTENVSLPLKKDMMSAEVPQQDKEKLINSGK